MDRKQIITLAIGAFAGVAVTVGAAALHRWTRTEEDRQLHDKVQLHCSNLVSEMTLAPGALDQPMARAQHELAWLAEQGFCTSIRDVPEARRNAFHDRFNIVGTHFRESSDAEQIQASLSEMIQIAKTVDALPLIK